MKGKIVKFNPDSQDFLDFQEKTHTTTYKCTTSGFNLSEPDAYSLLTRWRTAEGW
ncbi:MAG: hypothetical protein LBC87_00770 [Fibromonadaceae bacterium]|nr:hypothetical protein [Fibromonadaceae bacterium]